MDKLGIDVWSHIKQQYSEIFAYIRKNRQWVWLTLLMIVEFIVYVCINTQGDQHYEQYVTETAVNYSSAFAFIFFENLKTALLTNLAGIIPLGIGAMFFAFMVCDGLASTLKWLVPETGVVNIILCILPHGILEIPSMILSVMIAALWSKAVSSAILRACRRKPVLAEFWHDTKMMLKLIVLLEIPMILMAAAIESTISMWVVEMIL